MNRYYNLLKLWCDRLLSMQIKELKEKEFYGGIMCRSCSLIHGRIADCVYPLIYLYDKTGNKKYLDGAILVMDWADFNIRRKNGGYFNDKTNTWTGTTSFYQIAIGETLIHHSGCLDDALKDKWRKVFVEQTEFIYNTFSKPTFSTNINYFAAESACMSVAYKLTGEERYRIRAYEKFEYMKNHFNNDGLLCGEGKPHNAVTAKGCNCVDLGYNMEESLPLMALCGHMLEDEEMLSFCEEKILAHLEFMLPDGAIDNSFGTRSNKWTYWGSRTSDGIQSGFVYLAKRNPIIAEAMERNFELLEKCTHDGLLYGGAMYIDANEDPCSHHTFCHAKALAAMLDNNFEYKQKAQLPRDAEYGVRTFKSVGVNLISAFGFRATVSDYDFIYSKGTMISGGTMSVLWHEKAKLIFAAAKNTVTEPRNMQHSRYDDIMECTALRIVHGEFESVNDINACVAVDESGGNIKVFVDGKLADYDLNYDSDYSMNYKFSRDTVEISAKSSLGGELVLPIICEKNDMVSVSGDKIFIKNKHLCVSCDSEIILPDGADSRNFNTTGGFETLKAVVRLDKDISVNVKVEIL